MARLTTTTTSARPETAIQNPDEDDTLTSLRETEDVLDQEEILSDPVQDVVRDSLVDEASAPETSEDVVSATSEDTATTTSEDSSTATSEAPETENERDRVAIAAKRLKKAMDEDQQETTTV